MQVCVDTYRCRFMGLNFNLCCWHKRGGLSIQFYFEQRRFLLFSISIWFIGFYAIVPNVAAADRNFCEC